MIEVIYIIQGGISEWLHDYDNNKYCIRDMIIWTDCELHGIPCALLTFANPQSAN